MSLELQVWREGLKYKQGGFLIFARVSFWATKRGGRPICPSGLCLMTKGKQAFLFLIEPYTITYWISWVYLLQKRHFTTSVTNMWLGIRLWYTFKKYLEKAQLEDRTFSVYFQVIFIDPVSNTFAQLVKLGKDWADHSCSWECTIWVSLNHCLWHDIPSW